MPPTTDEIFEAARKKRSESVTDETFSVLLGEALSSPSVTRVERLWRCAYMRAFPGSFVKSWSLRDKGKVNQLRRELGDALTVAVVARCVERWSEFTVYLERERGHKGVSKKPTLGLLIFHRDAAVDWAESAPASSTGEVGQKW